MLKFIDENDFLLVDKYKQNEDGSVTWSFKDSDSFHSGVISEGFAREYQVQDGVEKVVVGQSEILDDNGNQIIDENGEGAYEDVVIEQPKIVTKTIDVWATLKKLEKAKKITIEPFIEDTKAIALANRQAAYKSESDALYLEAVYDGTDKSMKLWRDKVAEIKARYPL